MRRALTLALIAHLLLVLALTWGLNWQREAQDEAVVAVLCAPSVKRAALKNIGDIESMPWTCATNAKPQISAVNNRLSMPTSSCLFTGSQPNVRM